MTKKHTILLKAMLLFGFALATSVAASRAVAAAPSIRVLASDSLALQGGSSATFTLVRVGDTNSAIAVNYTVTGTATPGVDYVALSGSATIPAGQMTANVTVTPLNNPVVFGASDKTIDLTLVVGSGYNIVLPGEARMVLVGNRSTPGFVRITAPRIGQVFQMGANVTLVADVADPDNATQVAFYAGSTWLGTATSLPFSVVVTNPPPGTYTLTAKVTDVLGQVDTSAPVTVTVNNYAPTLVMTSPANGTIVTGVPPSVTLTAVVTDQDDAISSVKFFDFKNNVGTGTAGANNTYTLTLPNVANGTHSYTAQAVDAHNATNTSAGVQVLVQTTLPAVSLTSPAPLTTYNFGDQIPVEAVASSPYGVAQIVFYAGSTQVGTAVPGGGATNLFDASFSLPSQLLKPGNYKLSAKATDIYGRAATSVSVAVTIAPVPVSVTLNSPLNNLLITGSNVPPVIVYSATATTANVNDPIHIVNFYLDGKVTKSITNGTPPANNIYTFTTGTIANGSHTVYAQGVDQFGAKANSSQAIVNVLNFAPNIQLLNPVSNQKITTVPTFAAVAADADDVLTKVQFLANGNVVGTVNNGPNVVSNEYDFTWIGASAGTYSISAVATDVNGLTTQAGVATNVTIAYFGPVASITYPTNGTTFNQNLPLFLSVQATASDNLTNLTKVDLYDNGAVAAQQTLITPSTSYSGSLPVVLAPGTHKLALKVYDAANLTAWSATNQITIGNATPTVTLVTPTNGTAITVPPTVTLKAVATDPDDAIAQVTFQDGANVVATVSNSTNIANNTYTATLTNVSNGTHVYTAVAVDTFGASVTSSAATVTINNAAPTITLVGVTNGTTFSYPVNTQIHAVVTDADDGLRQVVLKVDSTVIGAATGIGGPITGQDFYGPIAGLTVGSHTLVVTATDIYGATTTSTTLINVSLTPVPSPDQPAQSSSSGSQTSSSGTSVVISSLLSLPDGGYQVTLTGPVGAKATLQSSSNFADWTTLANVVVGSNGSVQYTDTNAGGGRRYYRVQ